MKLEVGKWYLTRDGRTAFVKYENNDDAYVMKGFIEDDADEEYSWTLTGAYYLHRLDYRDLVEELNKEHELKVEVGKWYFTRDGRRVLIHDKVDDDKYCMIGRIENLLDKEYAWTIEGSFFQGVQHPLDLVKEIPPEETIVELKKEVEKLFRQIVHKCPTYFEPALSESKTICPFCYEKTLGFSQNILTMNHSDTCPIKQIIQLLKVEEDSNEA